MQNREEVIREFLNDKEKIKAISDDEEFISKVSEGKATPETYKEEFKKIGLELTDEESTQVADMIDKIQHTPPEKLEDLSLENISGGNRTENVEVKSNGTKISPMEVAGWAALGVAGAGFLTVISGYICSGIGSKYEFEAMRYARDGKTKLALEKYKKAKALDWMFPKGREVIDRQVKALQGDN